MPHSSRSTPQISPIVHRARSASRIGTSRLPSPTAPRLTSSRASAAVSWLRSARRRAVRSSCRRSISGSSRWSSIRSSWSFASVEAVHPHDHPLAPLDLGRVAVRGLLDLALDEALLDGGHGPSEVFDPVDQLEGAALQLVREGLDEVGPSERIRGVGRARLVLKDLLRAEGDPRGPLAGQRQRLVERVRVDRLCPAVGRRQRLDRDPHDVVLGLLRRQRRAARLCVEAEGQRTWVRDAEPLTQERRPQPPGGTELRDLLEEVVVRVEEEREPLAELVRREAPLRARPGSTRARWRG